ncbi:MAG: hypothetical protein ACE5D3_02045 [Candidatus Binatia bacterium]
MNLNSRVLLASAVFLSLVLVPLVSLAQTVSKAQAKCIATLNKSGAKVMATQSKENARCVKSAGRGLEPDASACLVADRKGKVAKARAKTAGGETKKCTETPVFGFTGAASANSAAVGAALGIVDDVFGADFNAAISGDRSGASCQAAVAKIYPKLASADVGAFISCKRSGLKDGTITSATLLEGCFDAIAVDPRKKIARALGKLASIVAKKCGAVDLSIVFPGSCAGPGDFVDCVSRRVGCRVCLMLNGMDDLAEDCDLFDDGTRDGSCVDPSLTTTTTSTTTTTTSTLPPVLRNYEVTFGIDSVASSVGALSFAVTFATDAVSANCTGLIPTAVALSNENPAGTLNVSVFDVFGFAAPVDLIRCSLSAFSSNFDIAVGLLVDVAGVPIVPTPSVVVTDLVALP